MKYCVLLSFLLALLAGYNNLPAPSADRLPDASAAAPEFQIPVATDYGVRFTSDGEDSTSADLTDLPLNNADTSPAVYVRISPPRTITTPYAIRAPPTSTAI